MEKKPGTIIERQVRRVRRKFDIGGPCRADQYRPTTGIEGTFHVDSSVADIPDVMTGRDSATLECHPDGCRIRLVCRRVGGADEASEVAAPAQTVRFAP